MFGSKIRSWMENHIVRPRKKGNKNKNGVSNLPTTTNSNQNGHKGTGYTIYHGDCTTTAAIITTIPGSTTVTASAAAASSLPAVTTMPGSSVTNNINSISSPARRREVSPIQSHTTSRFGWQSPQHENSITSKSEQQHIFYLHHNSVKSQTISAATINTQSPHSITTTTSNNNSSILTTNKSVNSLKSLTASSTTVTTSSKDKKHKTLSPNIMFRKKCTQSKTTSGSSSGNGSTNNSTATKSSSPTKPQTKSFFSKNHQQQQQQHSNTTTNNHHMKSCSPQHHTTTTNSINNHQLQYQNNDQFNANHHHHNHHQPHYYQNEINIQNNNHHGDTNLILIKNSQELKSSLLHYQTPVSPQLIDDTTKQQYHLKKNKTTDSAATISSSQQQTENSINLKNYNNEFVRYGKILTSKNSIDSTTAAIAAVPTQPQINNCYNLTNSMLINYNNNNNINNNNNDNINANIPAQYHHQQPQNLATTNADLHFNQNCSNQMISAINYQQTTNNTNLYQPQQQQQRQIKSHSNFENQSRKNNTTTNNLLRTTRHHNTTTTKMLIAPPPPPSPSCSSSLSNGGSGSVSGSVSSGNNNHQLAHVINSLSSPESAYSTGYSTDGTSPGATYTPPEYYINMRTGTHYFPKSVNTLAIEATRQKFGLNKIEEMSPQDPLPNNHRRTESFDFSQSKIPGFGIPDLNFFQNQDKQLQYSTNNNNVNGTKHIPHNNNNNNNNNSQCQSPLSQTRNSNNNNNNALVPNFKGFESPSPRQRCRIRTNPWYSTTDTSSSGNTSFLAKKIELDAASSSSSGIKSSSEAGGVSDKNDRKCEKTSDSETESSSTEVEVLQRTYSPNTIRRRCLGRNSNAGSSNSNNGQIAITTTEISCHISHSVHPESDEDATLNEMMGKFDESYVYEKETDILSSDSDPTDCQSDLDTGQDAGDECDTDDLLDIDFIDTGSIQEIVEQVETYKNTGSCSYFNYQVEKKTSKMRRSRKHSTEDTTGLAGAVGGGTPSNSNCSKRKKRLLKTRKKSCENKELTTDSPVRHCRESRSLGGTPVSLRRRNQQSSNNKKPSKISPLTNRSNSLTFTEVLGIRGRFVAIAESEKALLKADLEADVKYKQLIHEAETILVTMKASALSISRETPVASPRRICNPPPNKRVEMLRNCEADIKRELNKHQKSLDSATDPNIDSVLINKRLELLRYDSTNSNSAPTSPKCGRMSPRKTHITNFINQIAPPEISRRTTGTTTGNYIENPSKSPQLQLNGRVLRSPKGSPGLTRRRFRSQSPRVPIYSDSDSDQDISRKSQKSRKHCKSETESSTNATNRRHEFKDSSKSRQQNARTDLTNDDINNQNSIQRKSYNQIDYDNRNVVEQPSLMSFRSIDMRNRTTNINNYCPQSEPLKRKIYRGSSSFERLKKSLDMESEIPKQEILEKISNMRRERNSQKSSRTDINSSLNNLRHEPLSNDEDSLASNLSTKQQLILNTIEDLKKSLEDQSVELNVSALECGASSR